MYNSGYIPFYRDELDDWLIQDPQRFMWWIWIRCRAAYRPCMQCVGQARVEVNLQYGELAVTKTHLKNVWGVNIKTVDRFLKQMIKDGRISCRDEKGVLIIRIVREELISAPSGKVNETHLDIDNEITHVTENKITSEMDIETDAETSDEIQDELHDDIPSQMTAQIPSIIRNKENNNQKNFDIDLPAREKEFFEELKKSDLTLEQMAYSLKPESGTEGLLLLLEEFINQCLSTDEFHNTFSEFKKHFMNWARKEIRSRITENKKIIRNGKKEKKPDQESGTARRRGAEISARSAADYEKPFTPQPETGHY